MKTSSKGLAFIEKEEGVILQSYDDFNDKKVNEGDVIKGTLTIGTGHTSAAGPPKVYAGQKITRLEADKILADDLSKVEHQVNNLVKVPITQNQFDALVSFQFNTGGLGRSSALRLLNQKDYRGAADALLQWSKGNNNPTLLLPRRKREREMFLAGGSMSPTINSTVAPVITGALIAGGVGVGTSQYPEYLWPMVGAIILVVLVTGYVIYRRKTNV